MVEAKKVVVLIACVAVFVLLSASTGGVGWLHYEDVIAVDGLSNGASGDLSAGLFRFCFKAKTEARQSCKDVSDLIEVTVKRKVIQAFMILSVLASIAAVVCVILQMVTDKISPKLISWLIIDASTSALVGLAIYTHDHENDNSLNGVTFYYGWSYALGWVGAIIALIVGVVVRVAFELK
ncbi:epithelial membrane protein 1-like [Clytia hemisphaerica]|uniref:Uncharacterized protein n=1 Tax=Clytia hemisphaerica TaxID=252671 RepID=A0A7M5X9A1_9CNID|eukprot:TCONS_00025501-protein